MRVIVLTSDKYLKSLRPFAYLFNKYYSASQEVLVAGFTPPDFELPGNFNFHSIGKFEDYPVGRWSDALIKLLKEIPDEAVMLMLEDYWITRPVNRDAIRMCYDYARQFHYVLKIDLVTDRLYAWGMSDYGTCGYIDLIRSDPASQYHMSLMTGIWRRENLLRVLIPNETPWQVELEGTSRLATMHEQLVLGTRQSPVKHILAHRGGDPGKVDIAGLDQVDIDAMRERGWL